MTTFDGVLYLSGPMSGYRSFNIPAFNDAAQNLRRCGYSVINPADLDDIDVLEASLCSDDGKINDPNAWGEFISRDILFVANKADGVVVIPNWHRSKGARTEVFVAVQLEKPIFKYIDRSPYISPFYVGKLYPDWLPDFLT